VKFKGPWSVVVACWAPQRGEGFGDYDGADTDEERDAVLELPDNLLVVRPELEIQDGQFEAVLKMLHNEEENARAR
jgi:hypothetical protein